MIKSQDELNPCNDGHRSSDVLVATIEKCERLQKQLDMAIKCLEIYADHQCWQDECMGAEDCLFIDDFGYRNAEYTLKQIKELEK
jgi:hypothetical protein